MRFVFVSNYINHHQIPFCNAMNEIFCGSFAFIQTEAMEEERIRMGWEAEADCPYLKYYDKDEENCRRLIEEADVVLFGGCEDESYIRKRLQTGKPVIRDSERLYRTGQWKAVSPRGLKKKYLDHTRYRKSPVYLLCAGAYVPSDFHIVRAYPGKMFRWGYFTETKHYDVEELFSIKRRSGGIPYILWAARMIDLKHPELAVETAGYLKEKGIDFRMDLIGEGPVREKAEALAVSLGLENEVHFLGAKKPEQVREYMEKADIFLFTSDRNEGWGAVVNEAMNSGCAVVADHMIGSVPYLIENKVNGLIYKDGCKEQLFRLTEKLATDPELCEKLGRNAYERITGLWNAEEAARRLAGLSVRLGLVEEDALKPGSYPGAWEDDGPCTPAPVISERKMKKILGL